MPETYTPPRANQLDVLEQIEKNTASQGSAVGTVGDAAATTDTGSFSILSLVKRSLQNWTTLLSRIPALISGAIPTVDSKNGTRLYDFAGNVRLAVTGTSSAATPLPTTYSGKEVMVHSKERCAIIFGTSALAAADIAATTGQLVLEAGERFHLKLAASVTHFRVVRDSADGSLTVTAVVS